MSNLPTCLIMLAAGAAGRVRCQEERTSTASTTDTAYVTTDAGHDTDARMADTGAGVTEEVAQPGDDGVAEKPSVEGFDSGLTGVSFSLEIYEEGRYREVLCTPERATGSWLLSTTRSPLSLAPKTCGGARHRGHQSRIP